MDPCQSAGPNTPKMGPHFGVYIDTHTYIPWMYVYPRRTYITIPTCRYVRAKTRSMRGYPGPPLERVFNKTVRSDKSLYARARIRDYDIWGKYDQNGPHFAPCVYPLIYQLAQIAPNVGPEIRTNRTHFGPQEYPLVPHPTDSGIAVSGGCSIVVLCRA